MIISNFFTIYAIRGYEWMVTQYHAIMPETYPLLGYVSEEEFYKAILVPVVISIISGVSVAAIVHQLFMKHNF
jgi:hypothetical protein